jgi:hypothetical protein
MMRIPTPAFLVLCFLLSGLSPAWGQYEEIGLGFKAGLNFSRFDGPSETGPNGEELESFSVVNGFHIGGIVNIKFTDLVGLRTEFTYTQRGTEYEYNGPSYYTLGKNTLQSATIMGTRKQTMKVTNAYVDIPLMAYYKIGYFEIFGGLNSSLLAGSTGGGNIEFNGVSPVTGNPVAPFTVTLNHNYKKDEAGQASAALQQVSVDGQIYHVPSNTGAYYDFSTRDKNYYRTFDFGLIAGLSYYLNDNLFISGRYIHGLTDVDRNEYDVSLRSLQPNGSPIARADKNTSRSFQFSVGFSF